MRKLKNNFLSFQSMKPELKSSYLNQPETFLEKIFNSHFYFAPVANLGISELGI